MEYLPNGFLMDLPRGTFPLSTDSMVLSAFVRLPKQAKVLDLGAGCGTLGLLLCAKDDRCTVTGLELAEEAHLGALENIARNGLQGLLAAGLTLGAHHALDLHGLYFAHGFVLLFLNDSFLRDLIPLSYGELRLEAA